MTPADVGLTYRDATFHAADGVTLSGWYVPSRNGAAVVLLHGAGSTRSDVLDHAVVVARHGYGVLLYDARGHGRSGGRAMDSGWYGDQEIAGAVSFLEHQNEVDGHRIAAIGMSMGGEQAIGAAATIEGIRAVVAEGATNRVADDKAWMSDEFGLRGALMEGLEGFADLLTAASPPITLHDAVRAAAPQPVLLIAAGGVPDEAHVITPLMRLQDPSYSRVLIVTLAETTPIAEATALQNDLRRVGIEPYGWVVNATLDGSGTTDPILSVRASHEHEQIARVTTTASRTWVLPWDPGMAAAADSGWPPRPSPEDARAGDSGVPWLSRPGPTVNRRNGRRRRQGGARRLR